ncbi:rod shape-determining protein RodA [Candidatus Parcubacteria bacterium]|nr:rod shape-determining protein RodA [Candidatus Parcubacteria bacterium]
MELLKHFQKLDWILIAIAGALVAFGLLLIYSCSLGSGDFLNFQKQIIFFSIGIFLMFLASFVDFRSFKNEPYLILAAYFFCLLSLAGLFFFGPEIRGVKGWYKLGPVSIDPIEFTKLILIILLAKYFSLRHIEMYRVRHILLSGLYVFLPAALIFFQPDMGSVMVLVFLWIGVLLISGIKLRHFLVLLLCGLILFAFSWMFLLKDYQKERIISFVQPQFEPLGIGWSQTQAKIAIGNGGLLGQGIGKGSQTQYGFLSEPQTDFIFSAIAEETGLAGVTVLLTLFLLFMWRILRIAAKVRSNFSRLFISGFAVLLAAQIFINIGMNLGLLPIIGIPMPFVSYGGSGMIMFFIALGILQNIKTEVDRTS